MLGEGQLIQELKPGGVNHHRIRKWGKTVCARGHTSQGDLLATKEADTPESPPLEFEQSQERPSLK
jgi:hypothetical protein